MSEHNGQESQHNCCSSAFEAADTNKNIEKTGGLGDTGRTPEERSHKVLLCSTQRKKKKLKLKTEAGLKDCNSQ